MTAINYLVETGKYNAEEIKDPWSRGFIEGLKAAMESCENCIGSSLEFWTASEDTPLYEKVAAELREEGAEACKDHIYCDMCEAIVSFLDNEA